VRGFRHYAGLDKLILDSGAGEDEAWGYAALVLVDGFGDPGELGGSGVSISVCAGAEDDDGVKAGKRGVGVGSKMTGEGGPGQQHEEQTCGG
jgi:hypothetical protein